MLYAPRLISSLRRFTHSILFAPIALAVIAAAPAHAARGTITLAVDASEVPRKILHVRLTIPAESGPLSLSYPKWIPGEHAPTGPLTDVAGLRITSGGQSLAWQRDLVDMYAVHCIVPSGGLSVEVNFDFVLSQGTNGFSSAASFTQQLALVSWNQVLLYPSGEASDLLTYAASLKLPAGWKYGTALPVEREAAGSIQFTPGSLTTLVDSPVIAGAHFRRVPLTSGAKPTVMIDMACDGEAGLEIRPETLARHRALVAEADTLFGARHFREYHFLLSLSDHVAHFGLEHHECSDDRAAERMWVDDDLRASNSNLLAHEFVHSWNGKYRRPLGLATPNYQEPMKDDLLWVYEGLTQYLGFVLAARSGIRSVEQAHDALALAAATLDHRPGRTWRPLVDTAVEAQRLYESSDQWAAWRRSVDFYDEGLLLWLDADVTIRGLTHGRRSLDDFCHRFHGAPSGPPKVVPYTLDDVVKTLNDVAPYDWRKFLDERVQSPTAHPPLGGIESGGWRIAYADSLGAYSKSLEAAEKRVDLWFSLGFRVHNDDGLIEDVIPGTPAAKSGLAPGMNLVAVNGRKWSKDALRDAVKATTRNEPVELLALSGEFYRSFKLDYRDGERYPHLVRDASRADALSEILKAHATR